MKAKWIWLLGIVTAVCAAALAWILGLGALVRRQEAEKAREEIANQFKAKVAALKAQRLAQKEHTDAAVAKVDETAKVDASRDPVELANALISGAKDSKG